MLKFMFFSRGPWPQGGSLLFGHVINNTPLCESLSIPAHDIESIPAREGGEQSTLWARRHRD